MNEILMVSASFTTALLLCVGTQNALGAMQQSGYKNGSFLRWLRRKDNLFFNRLAVFALCLALASAVASLCFSFLGKTGALACSAAPFFALCLAFVWSGHKYALKVPLNRTGRCKRLFVGYLIVTAAAGYGILAFLSWLAKRNGSEMYALVSCVPFCVMPVLLPLFLCLANGVISPFENMRNARFVKRAGKALQNTDIIRVGVVGSYGKTSVKNILKTLLSEKYAVVETPQSYNTPLGIAKTVFSAEFSGKEVWIAEMGARKKGDIAELCRLVKPDYAVFTGVCAQHVGSFGSVENVFAEKSEILKCGAKKVVCGESLRSWAADFAAKDEVLFADGDTVKDVHFTATRTAFTLHLLGREIAVDIPLLGEGAIENVLLAATLCAQLGMTAEEIARGIAKLESIPHRLQLIESGGAYILDDAYNCNPRGAKQAIAALARFSGRKCIVTPGIVECGVLEESINGELGGEIAKAQLDKIILVGDTLVGAIKTGYLEAGGAAEAVTIVKTLDGAQAILKDWLHAGDAVLFMNDLPDVY